MMTHRVSRQPWQDGPGPGPSEASHSAEASRVVAEHAKSKAAAGNREHTSQILTEDQPNQTVRKQYWPNAPATNFLAKEVDDGGQHRGSIHRGGHPCF